jgi:hypothetical protein
MIALDRPGIMQGLPPDADIKRTVWMYNFNADSNKMGSAGVAKAFSPTSDLWEFAKMLAKIAHGYTVASLGLNSFRPMLLDMIFDKGAKPFFLVGGSLHIPPPMETDEMHYLELSVTDVGYTNMPSPRFDFCEPWSACL